MVRSKWKWAALVIALISFAVPLTGLPAQADTSGSHVAGARSAVGTQSIGRVHKPSAVTLPHHTYHRADGSVDVVADPEAVAELAAAATAVLCGYTCDGKDPSSYKYDGATCSDARTIYTHDEGWAYAELRYSSRCGTAWTRSCCYARSGGFGYNSSGTQRSSVYNYGGVNTGTPVWTAMLYDYGALTYKACFDRVVAGTPSDWACTSKY
jgi:hypothetical protein